jgi:hypothetical protein
VSTNPRAITLAQVLYRTEIYLAEGTYLSSLQFLPGSALYVEGARVHNDATWHRDCAAGARSSTTITGGVSNGVSGGLRSLSVLGSTHFSSIAVRVATGVFTLRDWVLQANPGSAGAVGSDGAGTAPPSGTLHPSALEAREHLACPGRPPPQASRVMGPSRSARAPKGARGARVSRAQRDRARNTETSRSPVPAVDEPAA